MWETQSELAIECGELFGKTMLIQQQMKDLIVEAGFVDVREYKFKWPIGPWSNDPRLKDIGRWNLHSWNAGLEGWTMALLTRCKGVSPLPSPGSPFRSQWATTKITLPLVVELRPSQSMERRLTPTPPRPKGPCLSRRERRRRAQAFVALIALFAIPQSPIKKPAEGFFCRAAAGFATTRHSLCFLSSSF